MSAGLALFILSVIATIIFVVWSHSGPGSRGIRIKITCVAFVVLVVSWAALLAFGVFHPIGSFGMGTGFIISIAAFFVPMVYNKLQNNENT